MAELRHWRKVCPRIVTVFPGDVVKCDHAIGSESTLALQLSVGKFEKTLSGSLKGLRIGSNGTGYDIVDPSLFSLVYGRSRIVVAHRRAETLGDCIEKWSGLGVTLPRRKKPQLLRTRVAHKTASYNAKPKRPIPPDMSGYDAYSVKFQWLPCEVDISGASARFVCSYAFFSIALANTLY